MERAYFFKVMIADFAEKMHIPMQFVNDFGRELHSIDEAILNGPRGTGWRVRLKMEENGRRMIFQRGWRKFIKHHDVEEGYFLVFRYDGQSHFDVEVFDRSACLKKYACADYSCDSSRDRMGILCSQCHKDLRRAKERKNYPTLQHTIHRSQPSNIAMKRKKSESENKPKVGFKEKLRSHKKNRVTECPSAPESSNFKVSESEDNQETESGKQLKAEKEVAEGESSHPNPKHPRFTAVIHRSNLTDSYMAIPKEFRVANDLPIGRTMTLRDPKQRSWTVRISCRNDGRIYFSGGWIKLAVANGLEIGDVCFFEIIPSMKDVMNVQIKKLDTLVKNGQCGFYL